jgi:hypothetical protein
MERRKVHAGRDSVDSSTITKPPIFFLIGRPFFERVVRAHGACASMTYILAQNRPVIPGFQSESSAKPIENGRRSHGAAAI